LEPDGTVTYPPEPKKLKPYPHFAAVCGKCIAEAERLRESGIHYPVTVELLIGTCVVCGETPRLLVDPAHFAFPPFEGYESAHNEEHFMEAANAKRPMLVREDDEPPQPPSATLCATCTFWRDGDCRHAMRDAGTKWVVPVCGEQNCGYYERRGDAADVPEPPVEPDTPEPIVCSPECGWCVRTGYRPDAPWVCHRPANPEFCDAFTTPMPLPDSTPEQRVVCPMCQYELTAQGGVPTAGLKMIRDNLRRAALDADWMRDFAERLDKARGRNDGEQAIQLCGEAVKRCTRLQYCKARIEETSEDVVAAALVSPAAPPEQPAPERLCALETLATDAKINLPRE